eukprot:CAMPEP_0194033698 /NCGR_PEP_ID=MMETSP0009_2-20130614/6278_1 /TAXON_ID=210454 /ORGANISM="Grammatophora oceanica, Strain CCMP 410" /LENGTH=136 /DNA_ID=CAMNT_0038674415 /DNA_START=69 /DNA_END=476 /DNA_ORIENTATION=-
MTSGNNSIGYGSVSDNDEEFDVDQLRYIQDSHRRLPLKERLRKGFVCLLPLLISVLIMGGVVLLLLRDFGNLYPGRAGHSDEQSASQVRVHPQEPPMPLIPQPVSSQVASASCSETAKCHSLGLTGNCCPTDGGVW